MTLERRMFGAWGSPLTPRMMAGGIRLNDVQWDDDGTLVWCETRGGQGILVAQSDGQAMRDLTDADTPVRARVGYGGGDFTVANGVVYFAGAGGRLYRLPLSGGQPRPITPAFGSAAAPRVSADGKWLCYIHHDEGTDGVALVDTEGKLWPRKLAYGTDFVMQAAWHPSGTHIAYIAWDHPNMPWDATELRLITLAYDATGVPYAASETTVASGAANFQPEFSPDGSTLAYISDTTGFGQLYLYDLASGAHTQLTEGDGEHGTPAWIQGQRMYGWSKSGHSLYFIRNLGGIFTLWRYNLRDRSALQLGGLEHYTHFEQIAVSGQKIAVIASSSTQPQRLISYDIQDKRESLIPDRIAPSDEEQPSGKMVLVSAPAAETIHRRTTTENIPAAALAKAQPVEWPTSDGETAYGLYYPPTSDRYEGIGNPPLIVLVHGGPTSQSVARWSAAVQFFATRGWAVLEVNHRGSTGYGKDYMNKLRGAWGYYDVQDSADGAQWLASQGLADASKFVIMGGSAGGYTVLQSLVDKPGFYKAGVCLYGISNQFTLVSDTHKFEERYSDSLLGELPQAAALYRERSPLFHANRISDPLIIFQGLEDNVVTPSQSEAIVAALKARGVPHEYHAYEGEGHGWRKPETIEHYYKAVVAFLKQHVLYA